MTSDNKYVPLSIRDGRRSIPQLGIQDMPPELRLSLWNVIEPWLWEGHYSGSYEKRARWVYNFHAIRWPTNEIPSKTLKYEATNRLHYWFMSDASCDEIYDFIEGIPEMVYDEFHVVDHDLMELKQRSDSIYRDAMRIIDTFVRDANNMLEREGSPYRFLNNLLTPITNDVEIEEVNAAVSGIDRFSVAREHIAEGLKHLGARPPAYADCIKQSISGIESALRIAADDKKSKMASLLRKFEDKYGGIHPSLRAAIDKLYGYASDEDGVRHGATAAVTVGEAEARAMLVTCSALMNFLIRKTSA